MKPKKKKKKKKKNFNACALLDIGYWTMDWLNWIEGPTCKCLRLSMQRDLARVSRPVKLKDYVQYQID
jgi:hypothetical protein